MASQLKIKTVNKIVKHYKSPRLIKKPKKKLNANTVSVESPKKRITFSFIFAIVKAISPTFITTVSLHGPKPKHLLKLHKM